MSRVAANIQGRAGDKRDNVMDCGRENARYLSVYQNIIHLATDPREVVITRTVNTGGPFH